MVSIWMSNNHIQAIPRNTYTQKRKEFPCSSLKTLPLAGTCGGGHWRKPWHRSGDRTPSDACGSVRGHRLCQQRRACPAVRATDHGRLRCGRSRDHMQGGCHRRRAGARHGVHHGHHVRRISTFSSTTRSRITRSIRATAKPSATIGWSDYAAQLEGCLKGAYNTCEAVLPQMRRQAGGRIINISSNLVDSPIVPYHDYTAAKGALVGFTRSLAQEAGRLGRDRERHRGRTDRGHRFESGHHRGHARAHHRLHAAWTGSPPPRTSPAPWPCSRETMPRSSRDRPCMSTAVW